MTENRTPSRARLWATRALMVIGGMTVAFLAFLLFLPVLFLRGEPMPGRVILELDLESGRAVPEPAVPEPVGGPVEAADGPGEGPADTEDPAPKA